MTFDREKHDKKGRRFLSERNCYLHIEVKDGRLQSQVSGDSEAIITAVYEILYRLSKEANIPFLIIHSTIRALYDMDKEVKKKHGTD